MEELANGTRKSLANRQSQIINLTKTKQQSKMAVTRDSMRSMMTFVENSSKETVDIKIFTERNSIEIPQVYMINEINELKNKYTTTHDYEFCSKQGTFVYEARKIEGVSYKRHKQEEE